MWKCMPMNLASLTYITHQDNTFNKKKRYSLKNKTLRKSKRSQQLRKYLQLNM